MEKNKYQELSPRASDVGSASGVETVSREETQLSKYCSLSLPRSLVSPTGAYPGGLESQREKRGQPHRHCPLALARLTSGPRLLPSQKAGLLV